jgi:hypothetical protein
MALSLLGPLEEMMYTVLRNLRNASPTGMGVKHEKFTAMEVMYLAVRVVHSQTPCQLKGR